MALTDKQIENRQLHLDMSKFFLTIWFSFLLIAIVGNLIKADFANSNGFLPCFIIGIVFLIPTVLLNKKLTSYKNSLKNETFDQFRLRNK